MGNRSCGHTELMFLLLIGVAYRTAAYTTSDASSLHSSLLGSYTKNVLPSAPVDVMAEFNLLAVNSMIWTDSRLSWTPASNGNIEYIYLSQNQIWHPELTIGNSVKDFNDLGSDQLQIQIMYTGEVRWEPAAILSTSCDMDVTFFPYDFQTCDVELTSWGFHTDSVNLTFYKSEINLNEYRKNAEWDLTSTFQTSDQLAEGNLTYSELKFWVKMHRYPGHYIMSVIFPVILISVLSGITFILPVESGAMIQYILTVLLALAVLLTLFSANMPTTSKHTSILVVYLTVTLALATLVIIIIVLITYLYYSDEYKVPSWMYRFAHKCKQITQKCGKKASSVKPENGDKDVDINTDGEVHKKELHEIYTNQDIAHFWGHFFFLVFFFLYVGVSLVFTITLSASK